MENPTASFERLERLRVPLKIVIDFLSESTSEESLPEADAIFVFGHYDPRVAVHAAHLWHLGKGGTILVAGKGRDKIPDGFKTEADYYASLLKKEGVPANKLVLEKGSTNTLENVHLGVGELRCMGLAPRSLILVAMPPLLRRSLATFHKQFPDITIFGSAFPISVDELLIISRIHRLLGEFDRFEEYAKKGDIVTVSVPDEVQNAVGSIRGMLPS